MEAKCSPSTVVLWSRLLPQQHHGGTHCLIGAAVPLLHGILQLELHLSPEVPQLLELSSPLPYKGLTIPNKGSNLASSFYKAFYGPGCLK